MIGLVPSPEELYRDLEYDYWHILECTYMVETNRLLSAHHAWAILGEIPKRYDAVWEMAASKVHAARGDHVASRTC